MKSITVGNHMEMKKYTSDSTCVLLLATISLNKYNQFSPHTLNEFHGSLSTVCFPRLELNELYLLIWKLNIATVERMVERLVQGCSSLLLF